MNVASFPLYSGAEYFNYPTPLIACLQSTSPFSPAVIIIMAPKYQGRCYCGAILWSTTGKVDFTSMCHCKDCQTVAGSAFGTTSLMIYDRDGVKFEGKKPKVFHAQSGHGSHTQRYVRSSVGYVSRFAGCGGEMLMLMNLESLLKHQFDCAAG